MAEKCEGCDVQTVRVDELEARIFQRFDHEKELREKLSENMERRLDEMNKFRHQLDKQSSTFVTWYGLASALVAAGTLTIAAVAVIVQIMVRGK